MDLPECYTHSFIVKIWLEVTAEEAERATWRGHVTHVPSGERRYVKDLDDITAFILSYLTGMGVDLGLASQPRSWWRRCWRRTRRTG
jgi:hypothetical protein